MHAAQHPLTMPQGMRYDAGVSKEMVFETTVIAGKAAPSERLCHARIPSSFWADGSIREDGHTARSVVSTSAHPVLKRRGETRSLIAEHDMNTQVATISATPDLEIIEGQITTTSQQIAAHFGKRHADVIRAIRKLESPEDFNERNFALVEFTDAKGEKRPAYRITRDGFTLLAMGFTGKEAMQWKLAYLAAFNKMEQELLARTTRPANPALDYDRISPAQAQDLKELVHSVVDAKVQGFAETWARLHKKFRVNSYLELPATRFDEARDYLLGKLPETPAPALPDMNRTRAAFDAAAQAAASVQTAVFNAVLAGNDEWKFDRWLLAFIDDSVKAAPAHVWRLNQGDFIANWPKLVKDVATGECMCSSAELLDMASACMQRLQERSGPVRLAA